MTTAVLDLTALEQALPTWGVPGLQVVAVRQGEVLFSGGLGTQGVDVATPVTARSLFDHGSCGKAYTALLASLLHEEGLLDVDAPVRVLVPELALPDEGLAERVTCATSSHPPGTAECADVAICCGVSACVIATSGTGGHRTGGTPGTAGTIPHPRRVRVSARCGGSPTRRSGRSSRRGATAGR